MIIKAICMAYNEAFLMPFFLRHYAYLDGIHLIVDSDTTDATREIARSFPNVTLEEFQFPDGMDDILKRDKLNEVARGIVGTDWIYVLDADELIFPPGMENPRVFLARQTGNVVMAKMWTVYRHVTDRDLDATVEPVVMQRRHGNPNREPSPWVKPIVIKMPFCFTLELGNHQLTGPVQYATEHYDGAHWAMADTAFAMERRIKNRRDRQSKRNLELGLTFQHHHITASQIAAECKAGENFPLLF